MSDNLFEGKLVRLRAYEPGDVDLMCRHLKDTEISRRDGDILWPFSRAQVAQHADEMGKMAPEHDNKSLAIETLDGRLIGGLSVFETARKHGTFHIGIGLADRAEWGKGFAKDAMLLMMRYMFHELRYQKCDLGVYAFNERALGLYQRLGFTTEGRKRRAIYTAGEYHDEVLMGMTREEFDAQWPEWRVALSD